jgi:hypothetical protein
MCPCICSAVSFSTAGSRQPLLVRMCRCVCAVTLVFRLFVLPCTMANHGGLTPPALALVCGRLPAKKTIFAVHKRTFDQERRASARRGEGNVLAQENECVVRGGRQNQERRASARRGSQTAPATAIVYGRVIAFLADDRHRHHGRLTPAAPGCTHAYRRKCGVAICNGLRPGWG